MLSRNKTKVIKASIFALISLVMTGNALAAGKLDQSIAIDKQTIDAARKSQAKINRFAEQTLDMLADYKNTLRVIEQMKDYNASLERLIQSQEEEMASIQRQMDSIDATERGVIPLMNEMIDVLDDLIKLDIPFKLEDRQNRVNELRNLMLRADVSNAEKYRKILEAYQTEMAYGESMETYQGDLGDRRVDFLRVGRILLVYLTLDGTEAGMWDAEKGQFVALGDEYLRSIEEGIKIAKKQATFNLIKLPVPAAKGAQ